MLKLRLSQAAEQQLEEIWSYTLSEWGEAQAEKYFDLLENALYRLLENPHHGRPCPDITPGYRACRAGRRVIFYRVGQGFVDVIGILHRRMEPDRHLAPDHS